MCTSQLFVFITGIVVIVAPTSSRLSISPATNLVATPVNLFRHQTLHEVKVVERSCPLSISA